jgi:hypothetical protein
VRETAQVRSRPGSSAQGLKRGRGKAESKEKGKERNIESIRRSQLLSEIPFKHAGLCKREHRSLAIQVLL